MFQKLFLVFPRNHAPIKPLKNSHMFLPKLFVNKKPKIIEKTPGKTTGKPLFYPKLPGKSVGFPAFFPGVFFQEPKTFGVRNTVDSFWWAFVEAALCGEGP